MNDEVAILECSRDLAWRIGIPAACRTFNRHVLEHHPLCLDDALRGTIQLALAEFRARCGAGDAMDDALLAQEMIEKLVTVASRVYVEAHGISASLN